MRLSHLDLFSGIGGFSLAAQWAGFTTVGFCEVDQYCTKILKKHWPSVPNFGNVKNIEVDIYGNLIHIDDFGDVYMGCKKDSRYNAAKIMYESGLSIGQCAEFYEISRQAMHKILSRRGTVFRDKSESNHFNRGGSKASDRAHNLMEKAIEKGILIRKSQCETCGDTGCFKDGRTKIQAHHDDYNKPLDVRWLCQKCHHTWHKYNTAKGEDAGNHGDKLSLITGGFP